MKVWHFSGLLQKAGWHNDVVVAVNDQGIIEQINTNPTESLQIDEYVKGYAIPGFQNAHSHAFQYAMSGLAEIHPDPMAEDDFWSWRDTMYKIALSIGPEELEAVATMLYMEMLKHGYTAVAEFHYLHHDQNGKPYNNLSEMGERLVAAAQNVGIRITLVPIFYQKGGFGIQPKTGQRRFISETSESYLRLLEASNKTVSQYDMSSLGVGIHSLRAVGADEMTDVSNNTSSLPVHIHISEQLKEVEDCLEYYGARPVQWLLDHLPVDPNYHLVHATHLVEEETIGIANSGAHVVLCPSTEGNLGDGIFPLKLFQKHGGKWSIGTDSHIGLNPFEELRILDYGQRLTTHRRNNFVSASQGNTGHYAIEQSWFAGRQAMGQASSDYFEVGQPLDAAVIDGEHPLIASGQPESILPTSIFSGDCTFLMGTMVAGDWKIQGLRHQDKSAIQNSFIKALNKLKIR